MIVPEWRCDPLKDRLNRRRHNGLSLADGVAALMDPLAISKPDPHPDGDRWQLVGSAAGVVTLFVVYTESPDISIEPGTGRIVSVRNASPRERRAYENGDF